MNLTFENFYQGERDALVEQNKDLSSSALHVCVCVCERVCVCVCVFVCVCVYV